MKLLLTTALLVGASSPAWSQISKFVPAEIGAGDQLGRSVSFDGRLVVLGAARDDDNGSQSGSIFVYDTSTGSVPRKIQPANPNASDYFGAAVASSGSFIVATAPGRDVAGSSSGSLFVFDAATGTQLWELQPSDALPGDNLGWAVAMHGTKAVVGVISSGTNIGGAAYVFDVSTGTELARLTANDTVIGDRFGQSVDIDGNTVIVGAMTHTPGTAAGAGAAYIFDLTTGVQLHKLVASDGSPSDWFGIDVAIDQGVAVIGAGADSLPAGNSGSSGAAGSAYVFDVATGTEVRKLFAEDSQIVGQFGSSVDLDGNRIIIGATDNWNSLGGHGAAYVFDTYSGVQVAKLVPSDTAHDDDFGSDVSIHNGISLIGSSRDDDGGTDSGAAYFFSTPNPADNFGAAFCFGDGTGAPCPCSTVGSPGEGCPSSSGTGVRLQAAGNASVALDTLRFQVTGAPDLAPGLLIRGDNQIANTIGDGILCTGGGLMLSHIKRVHGGSVTFLDFGGAPFGSVANIGTATNFQFWFRDLGASCTGSNYNYSNAWTVVYQP